MDAKAQFLCVGKSGSLGWLGTTDSLGPPQADTGTLIALLSTSLANTAHHCVLLTTVLLCVVLFWPTVVLDFSSWSLLVLFSTAHCPLCYCPMSTLVLWSLCCWPPLTNVLMLFKLPTLTHNMSYLLMDSLLEIATSAYMSVCKWEINSFTFTSRNISYTSKIRGMKALKIFKYCLLLQLVSGFPSKIVWFPM